jgi:hypothetical protein
MKSSEIKVPAAPESTTVVVLMVFRQVLEINVIGMQSSFRSPTACTSCIVTLEDTDIIPVFHIKNPQQGNGFQPCLLLLLLSFPGVLEPSSSSYLSSGT